MRLAALGLPRPLAVHSVASLRGPLPLEAAATKDSRQRKQMSRSAGLAARVLREALVAADWHDGRECIGAFLGVGGSGAALGELAALLVSSVEDGRFSVQRFGERGLFAANPLLAFQLMNNFTLCHGGIECHLGGPSGAFFSRGAGTVAALHAAAWAILDGDCARALAGGADTALHPVTRAELFRQGALGCGLTPDEGAAVLTLSNAETGTAVELYACGVVPCAPADDSDAALLCALSAEAIAPALEAVRRSELWADVDCFVTSGAVQPVRELFRERLAGRAHLETAVDGETLAAAPALAWAAAIEKLHRDASRVLCLSVGLDGDLGVAALRRRR
jgi:hypothetical protein